MLPRFYIVLSSLAVTKLFEKLEKSGKRGKLEVNMDVNQNRNRNLGLIPPLRVDTGRSYASVVSSSFDDTSSSNQAEPEYTFNESRRPSLETKRAMMDASTRSNNKKKRISSINNQLNQERSRSNQPCDDIHTFLRQLDRALESEFMYQAAVQPSAFRLGNHIHTHSARTRSTIMGSTGDTITREMRDGSAHVLRFLKVWYDMPSDVFFGAVNNVDRFLRKMNVS